MADKQVFGVENPCWDAVAAGRTRYLCPRDGRDEEAQLKSFRHRERKGVHWNRTRTARNSEEGL